jgi:hypothetical protein
MQTRESRRKLLEATAHHEPGHTVAAWQTGVKFKRVTIKPSANDGSLGQLLHNPPQWLRPDIDSSDRVTRLVEQHIIVSFAGQLAEGKFRGKAPRYGMRSDDQKAVDLAIRVCGSEETTNAYLKYCWFASRDIVNVRWPEIQAVALALMKQETLNYAEILEVIMPGTAALRASLARGSAKKKAAAKKAAAASAKVRAKKARQRPGRRSL